MIQGVSKSNTGCTRIQKQQTGGSPCFGEFGVLIPEPQRPERGGKSPDGRDESMGTEQSGETPFISLFPQNGHPALALDLKCKPCPWLYKDLWKSEPFQALEAAGEAWWVCVLPELFYRTFSMCWNPSLCLLRRTWGEITSWRCSWCLTLSPPTAGRECSAPELCGCNPKT